MLCRFLSWLFAFSVLSTASAESGATNRPSALPQPLNATQLLNMSVENIDGIALGQVRNIAVNLQAGEIAYVIIDTGGLLPLGSSLRPVPPRTISAATAKRNTLKMIITPKDWDAAPTLSRSEMESLQTLELAREIDAFYDQTLPRAELARNFDSSSQADGAAPLTPTGRPPERAPREAPGEIRMVSDLIGRVVRDRNQVTVGEISELLVTLEERSPVLAVVTPRRPAKTLETYAIPLRNLTVTGKTLSLDAPADRLREAPLFKAKALEPTASLDKLPLAFQYETTSEGR